MSCYTVKHVREAIEGLDEDQAVFGFIVTGEDIPDRDGENEYRPASKAEWDIIVTATERLNNGRLWDAAWELLNDAISETFPEPEVQWCPVCKQNVVGIVADHVDTDPEGDEHLHCPTCGEDVD